MNNMITESIVTIDFETFWSDTYNLKSLSTYEYINSDHFDIIGVSIAIGMQDPVFYYGDENIYNALDSIDWRKKAVLAHNTRFDGSILAWKFGKKPQCFLDTYSMSRPFHCLELGGSLQELCKRYALGSKLEMNFKGRAAFSLSKEEFAKVADYCNQDVKLTRKLFMTLHPKTTRQELLLINAYISMYTHPTLRIDTEQVNSILNDEFANEERKRALTLLDMTNTGHLPIALTYYGARTGRAAGGDKFNIHSLPRKSRLRKAIVAPSGHTLLSMDLDQIEPRIIACITQEPELVLRYNNNEDVYLAIAKSLFEFNIPDSRQLAKIAFMGLCYGMGSNSLRKVIGDSCTLTEYEIGQVVHNFRTKYSKINDMAARFDKGIAYMEHKVRNPGVNGNNLALQATSIPFIKLKGTSLILPNKIPLQFNGLQKEADGHYSYVNKGKRVKIYGYKVLENITQALANIILTTILVKVSNQYTAAFTVHDEIVFVIRDDMLKDARSFIKEAAEDTPEWMDIPVTCSFKAGKSYGDME